MPSNETPYIFFPKYETMPKFETCVMLIRRSVKPKNLKYWLGLVYVMISNIFQR